MSSGRDENISPNGRRRPTSTRRALWSTSTSRKAQSYRRRPVENLRMVDVDQLLITHLLVCKFNFITVNFDRTNTFTMIIIHSSLVQYTFTYTIKTVFNTTTLFHHSTLQSCLRPWIASSHDNIMSIVPPSS